MQLSNEDNLRLNVLLAQKPQAIRINESTMTVFALTERGEAKIQLNPTARDEQYLRWVRELLSMKVTGSPGGYPVFIKRWTRMGHTHNTLEHMLLLGEPEAVVAVAYAQELSHEIGRRVWWANPTIEIARKLLEHPEIIQSDLGKELANFLMEFLPFEERQLDIVHTIRLCLQDDLITEKARQDLWKKAKRKNPYYVGFIHAKPECVPETQKKSHRYDAICHQLAPLIQENNIYAKSLQSILCESGQQWLTTLKNSLKKPVDQDVVISLFLAIDAFFTIPFPEQRGVRHIEDALKRTETFINQPESAPTELTHMIQQLDDVDLPLLEALLLLSQLGEDSLIPIFGGNDSVGSVMRKRLSPLTTPILEKVDILMA